MADDAEVSRLEAEIARLEAFTERLKAKIVSLELDLEANELLIDELLFAIDHVADVRARIREEANQIVAKARLHNLAWHRRRGPRGSPRFRYGRRTE